jgi:hypothetical protein
MCLHCGRMRAHGDMGKPGVNLVYEGLKRAAEANGNTVDAALATIAIAAEKARSQHRSEYEQPA